MGSSYNTVDESTLEQHDITHILNVADEVDDVTGPHKKKRVYQKYVIEDMLPNDIEHETVKKQWTTFEKAFDFIGIAFLISCSH